MAASLTPPPGWYTVTNNDFPLAMTAKFPSSIQVRSTINTGGYLNVVVKDEVDGDPQFKVSVLGNTTSMSAHVSHGVVAVAEGRLERVYAVPLADQMLSRSRRGLHRKHEPERASSCTRTRPGSKLQGVDRRTDCRR